MLCSERIKYGQTNQIKSVADEKQVTEEDAEEFLKNLKAQDYSVID